jgi:regulatory protein
MIDPQEYEQKIEEILKKKSALEKEKNELKRNYKLASYAISRGFESDIVWEKIKKFSI